MNVIKLTRFIPICGYAFISYVGKNKEEHDRISLLAIENNVSRLIKIFQQKAGVPGICVHVNVNGNYAIDFSYGYSDVENLVKTKPDTLMRIASISKSFTSLIAAKLVDEGLLDLDKDINFYLPDFPLKIIDNKNVQITCRELLSHRSGIRHYKELEKSPECDCPEFVNSTHCNDSKDAMKVFQDDPLVHVPGEKFLYSTFGYVLLGSVLEKAAEKSAFFNNKMNKSENIQFLETMFARIFRNLELKNTHCEYHHKILANRTSYYERNCTKKCLLQQTPYVDNSCKWAGGGIVSTCQDLSKFAQNVVEIWLGKNDGIISLSSLKELWNPILDNKIKSRGSDSWLYSLGWYIKEDKKRMLVGHLGGASGGTSALIINIPRNSSSDDYIIVTILCNMEELSDDICELAVSISILFQEYLSKKNEN